MSDQDDTDVQSNGNKFIFDVPAPLPEQGAGDKPRTRRNAAGRKSRARHYCFTWNNPPGTAAATLQCAVSEGNSSYVCFQSEIGKSGTPHLQGYIEFANPRTIAGIKQLVGSSSIHLEQRRGSQAEAIGYCQKAGGEQYQEYGTPRPGQGTRTDLETVKSDIQSGTLNELELVEKHFSAYARYHRFFGMYRELRRRYTVKPDYRKKNVIWFAGDTGTGKTAKALGILTGKYMGFAIYIRPSTTGAVAWFPNFSVEHRGLILDEFRSDIKLTVMLRLLDGFPYQVETKGGFVETHEIEDIIITSNYMPWECYPNKDLKAKQPLYRRIDECYWFPKGVNCCPVPWPRTTELKALLK